MYRLILAWALVVYGGAASAATLCATTTAELEAALLEAGGNDEADEIRIETGRYEIPPGGFSFRDFTPSEIAGRDIAITGGWINFFGSPCGARAREVALDTILDGNLLDRILEIRPSPKTNVLVQLITFVEGSTIASGAGAGAGLKITTFLGYEGDVTIERNFFIGNTSDSFGGGFSGGAGFGGVFNLTNNLFTTNSALCTHGAASITHNGPAGSFIANNTVINNSVGDNCLDGNFPPDGALRYGGNAFALLINNIFWGNETVDLRLSGSNITLENNNYGVLLGTPTISRDNYNFDPLFDTQVGAEGVLSNGSPLIDLGIASETFDPWQLPDTDLNGNSRVQGLTVELGAIESSDIIFDDGFEAQP